jgi:hypothetical protein
MVAAHSSDTSVCLHRITSQKIFILKRKYMWEYFISIYISIPVSCTVSTSEYGHSVSVRSLRALIFTACCFTNCLVWKHRSNHSVIYCFELSRLLHLPWQAVTHCELSIYHPNDALRDTSFMTECIWWMMYWCKNMHGMHNIKNPLLTNPALWNIPTRTLHTLSSCIRVEYYKMLLTYLKHHKLLPTLKGISFTYQIHLVCKVQCS